MATYDIDNLPAKFSPGDIINCPYSGIEKTITLPEGTYLLECWGGNGAGRNTSVSRKGGYSHGTYTTTADNTVLYLNAGGSASGNYGGWNGGSTGDSSTAAAGYGGGGATHIALRSGVLASLSSRQSDVLIVAGGAGGSGYCANGNGLGGYGGGILGGNGSSDAAVGFEGDGGTQSAGGAGGQSASSGSFGLGGAGKRGNSGYSGGGGGGYYGGGGGYATKTLLVTNAGGGGGGSGYVSPALSDSVTVMANHSEYVTNPSSNGYIRITIQDVQYGLKVLARYNGHVIMPATDTGIKTVPIIYDSNTIATLLANKRGYILLCDKKKASGDITVNSKKLLCDGKLFTDNIYIGERNWATLIVTAPTGSTVYIQNGSTRIDTVEVFGTWTFEFYSLGNWTIHASLDSKISLVELNVKKFTDYSTTIDYEPYIWLDYIGSSGTQYIDTNYIGEIYKTEINFAFRDLSGTTPALFGSMGNGTNYYRIRYSSSQMQLSFGNGTDITTSMAPVANTDYGLTITGNTSPLSYQFSGGSSISGNATYTGSTKPIHPILLFCYNRAGVPTNYSNIKLYGFKLYSTSTKLELDLVPAIRKSDNAVGLYDRVNDKLYTNAGTGSFDYEL